MAQTDLTELPASVYSNLVTFTWGTANVQRYISTAKSYTDAIGPNTFTALPNLEVKIPKQSGNPSDEPAVLTMPPVLPISGIALGTAFAAVGVLIEEIDTRSMRIWLSRVSCSSQLPRLKLPMK